MDFQIATELTAWLAMNVFDEGYVVSGDKSFQAAVKHLEELPIAQGHHLKCVRDILQGIFLSKHRALLSLEEVETSEDIEHCLELILNETKKNHASPG